MEQTPLIRPLMRPLIRIRGLSKSYRRGEQEIPVLREIAPGHHAACHLLGRQ